jgi:hypothetical protein
MRHSTQQYPQFCQARYAMPRRSSLNFKLRRKPTVGKSTRSIAINAVPFTDRYLLANDRPTRNLCWFYTPSGFSGLIGR